MNDPRQSAVQDWMDGLEELQQAGAIDADEQNMLIRYLDEHKRAMDEALAGIVPEYERRVAEDGQLEADQWLATTARALGEEHREQRQRVLGSLAVNRDATA